MRKLIIMNFGLIIIFVFSTNLFSQNLLNNPESVVYDPVRKCYLVSNKGNGKIIKINSLETQSVWNSDQNSIRGMHILNDHLYVCCDAGVVSFNLSNAAKKNTVAIVGRNFLNDITSDSSGYLFTTDSGNGKIYKVNPTTKTYSTFVNGLSGPNGLLYDKIDNRLLVCHWGSNAPIRAVNLANASVSLVVSTSFSDLDGLAEDSQGNIYFSSWSSNTIYRYDHAFSSAPVVVSSGHSGPADIHINKDEDVLAVPNFNNNTVDFITLNTTSINEAYSDPIESYRLLQNYPNPFNPVTTIAFHLPKFSFVRLLIYDINGRFIETLMNKSMNSGIHTVQWNAEKAGSGIYFYRIDAGKFSRVKKCLVVK